MIWKGFSEAIRIRSNELREERTLYGRELSPEEYRITARNRRGNKLTSFAYGLTHATLEKNYLKGCGYRSIQIERIA